MLTTECALPESTRNRPDVDRWAWLAWTTGCAALVAHFICAFQFYHAWSDASATATPLAKPPRYLQSTGRWSFHKLRGCDLMDWRRRMVVVCRGEFLSSPSVVTGTFKLVFELASYQSTTFDNCVISGLGKASSRFLDKVSPAKAQRRKERSRRRRRR